MNKFRLGVITGMSSLVIAVPALSVAVSAQTAESDVAEPAIPSQTCVAAMADLEEAHLAQFDLMNEQRKQHIQTRVTALNNAAGISDAAARKEALDQMHEDMRSQMESMKDSVPETLQTAMDAVKEACGDTFRMRLEGFKGEHPMMGKFMERIPGKLAERLGMTEEELKTALDNGQSVSEIAEEKGIELPARGEHMKMRF